jgi:hypothetical protein
LHFSLSRLDVGGLDDRNGKQQKRQACSGSHRTSPSRL